MMPLPLLARWTLTQGINFGARLQSTGGATFSLRGNVRSEIRKIERLTRSHDLIQIRALNLAARRARTDTVRRLASEKNLPQRVLRRRIQAYKAMRHKRPFRASLWVGTRKPIRVNEIGDARVSPSGLVRIGKRQFRGAFRARMPSGHVGIFTRRPGARHQQRADGQSTQLPIQESVVQLEPEARWISRRAAENHLKTTFPKEVRRLMALKLRRGL